MKHVLFISHWLAIGGTETFMMNVLRNINLKKYHIDFLIFSNSISNYTIEAETIGCTIYRLPPRSKGIIYYKELKKFFKEKADIYSAIHFCGGNVSSIAPIYYAWKYNIPIRIIHSHSTNSVGPMNKIMHWMNKHLLRVLGNKYLACSPSAAKYFFGNNDVEIIKNGININLYHFNPENRIKIRNDYQITESTHVLGHIGRFDDNKNQSFLVDVFKLYLQTYQDALLILIGTGPMEEFIKSKCEELGISDKVLFLGVRSDISDLLCAMDCFIMPSFFEGLPFVLIEAQATGLPCVASDNIGKEAKLSRQFSFLSLEASLTNWVSAISDFVNNSKNRNDEGDCIKDTGYNIKSTIEYLEDLYDK